jgi:hypothetical protein
VVELAFFPAFLAVSAFAFAFASYIYIAGWLIGTNILTTSNIDIGFHKPTPLPKPPVDFPRTS